MKRDRVAIITGAGSGIGRLTAHRLAGEGYGILGIGRNAEKLAALQAELPDVRTLALDITADDAPARALSAVLEAFGQLDVIVNNAGIGDPKALLRTSDAQLDAFINVNVRAPFRLIREALPVLKSGASIVNITSTYAVVGGFDGGAYSVAKAALWGLTSHCAVQYGPRGIRSNAVAPAVVPTEMIEATLKSEPFLRLNRDMTPAPRLGKVEDIANAIAFLASPRSGFINGQHLVVDGGWTTTKFLSYRALTSTWEAANG